MDVIARGLASKASQSKAVLSADRLPHLFALIGDSRAENFATSASLVAREGYKSAQHPLNWFNALAGQRLQMVFNGGKSGKRSDEWQSLAATDTTSYPGLGNVDAMLSTRALWAFFTGIGVNDISQGYTADQVWAGYNGAPALPATLARVLAAGMRPVIFLEPGSTSLSAGQVPEVHRLNAYLRSFCLANPACVMVDVPALIWSGTATSTTAIAFRTGYMTDGTHLAVKGAHAIGSALVTLLAGLVPPRAVLPSSPTEIPANGRVQLVNTPWLLPNATTQGAVTGFTFSTQMPAGLVWVRGLNGVNATGAATATCSIIADPNGFGQALQIAATFSQDKEFVQVDLPTDTTGIVPGDILRGSAHVEIANGSANACIDYFRLQTTPDGGTLISAYDLYDDPSAVAFGAFPTTALSLDLTTGLMTVPSFASTLTSGLRLRIGSNGGAGSMTVTISRCGIYKRLGS